MLVVAVVDVKVVVGVVVVGSLHGCACWRCPPPMLRPSRTWAQGVPMCPERSSGSCLHLSHQHSRSPLETKGAAQYMKNVLRVFRFHCLAAHGELQGLVTGADDVHFAGVDVTTDPKATGLSVDPCLTPLPPRGCIPRPLEWRWFAHGTAIYPRASLPYWACMCWRLSPRRAGPGFL